MRGWVCLVCLGYLLVSSVSAQTTPLEGVDLERIQRATVLILQARSPSLTITCIGSGTIVRYDGLILTNAHHVVSGESCAGDTLLIAMTTNPDEPPVPRYRAEIVQADIGLDLALLRITREFDGRLIDPATLPVLPFVELSNSESIALDETLTLMGYPATGNSSVLVVPSTVVGFINEPRASGSTNWIKINTLLPAPGTLSGGGAYNRAGQLVGIPTTAPANPSLVGATCQILEDTNEDGFINNNDACVPIGDFINVLRPVNFARSLLRGASLGLNVSTLTSPGFQANASGEPNFSRLYFASAVADGLPTTVIGSAPAGTDSLYLFFDYQNMTPDTVYELRVNVDGVPNKTFDLPPVRWSGGQRGLWYIGSSGTPFPNGVYEYRLFINGLVVATQSIVIGGPAASIASFSNIVFGILGEDGGLQGNGYVLPTGPIATARFIYQNMSAGLPWTVLWYYNEIIIARTDDVWKEEDGANGAYPINLQPEGGLIPGNYRVDVYLNNLLSVTGDFTVAGEAQTALPQVFTNLEFINATTPQLAAQTVPASTYPDGAQTLFLRFDWQRITPGTPWTLRWRVDSEIFFEQTLPWTSPENGNDFLVQLSAPAALPDGTYTVDLLINNILLETATVSVGIGQLAIDELARAGGAQLRGRIIDAETGAGIAGATFLLISEEFSVGEFVWDEEQIYAMAVTDRNGWFEVDRPLRVGAPYSALVAVAGYLPLAADGLEVAPDAASPIEILIPLTKD
jgi:S1-C subfamily serine protease